MGFNIYKEASGYIHLSDKHFFNSTGTISKETLKFTTIIGANDNFITIEDRIETTQTMIEATKLVLLLLDSWTYNKNNPGLRERMQKRWF